MLATLALVVCALADPDRCSIVVMPGPMTMQECAVGGQMRAAEWLGRHPGNRLVRYVCRPEGRDA